MFPVKWGKPAPRVHRLHFVNPNAKRTVFMLASPSEHVTIHLHWLAEENASAPCIGEQCPLIGLTRHFDCCYTAVLQYAEKEGRWMPAILSIGDPGHTLANTDFCGEKIFVGRSKEEKDSKRVVYLGPDRRDLPPVPHVAKLFDVRPHLLRRWGMFKEADLIGCEFHPPEVTLEFPQENAG